MTARSHTRRPVAPPATSKPGRLLIALIVLLLGGVVWAFWPGTDSSVRLGLDLQGGTQVILVPQPVVEGTEITEEQLAQTVEIIRARVDGLGVAEAEVTTQGSGNSAAIVVSVPGLGQDRVVELVQRTALLNFRPVWNVLSPFPIDPANADAAEGAAEGDAAEGDAAESADQSASDGGAQSAEIVQAPDYSPEFQTEVDALDCIDPLNLAGGTPDNPTEWLGACDQSGAQKYVMEPAFIEGVSVTDANAQLTQQGIGWVVTLEFDSEGAGALAEASTELSALPECGSGATPCNAFAIVLDGVVVSAPRFNEPILGGQAQIEGDFNAQEARDLANVLKYGALPVTLDVVDITSVSATVGGDQLRAGIIAGLIGLALVSIYLLLYYRVLGLVAVASLAVAGGLLYLFVVIFSKTIGLTLTLAGIAGAIVAVGITADSFIVYFERMRDELRDGRSLRQACDSGWVRARRTLLAADFVTLLAAVVLYFLSIGSVRGFAFILGLTTVIDLIIAFWFTHPVVVLMGRRKFMQGGSKWSGLDPERLGGHSALDTLAGQSRRKRRDDYQSATPDEATHGETAADDSADDSAGASADDTTEVRS
ncbi:MAG: protein translocase subunit SecD [Candidatus Nanopelagicales bacterium]|nr:protein translocase subunit SecD [Candidatus Nanopelagicales bacterium]